MEMTIEKLQLKVENQSTLIKELTNENEQLFHQYNHLMIRNGKMLQRVDDLQKVIDDLHVRIEELQLINGNMMQINDRLRSRSDSRFASNNNQPISVDRLKALNDPLLDFNMEDLSERWRAFPGQTAQNGPNLKKQVSMLVHLYNTATLRSSELFNLAGVGGVTGARYVSTLKKYGLIRYTGARKKGHYEITPKGTAFIENTGYSSLVETAERKFDTSKVTPSKLDQMFAKSSSSAESKMINHDDL